MSVSLIPDNYSDRSFMTTAEPNGRIIISAQDDEFEEASLSLYGYLLNTYLGKESLGEISIHKLRCGPGVVDVDVKNPDIAIELTQRIINYVQSENIFDIITLLKKER